MSELKLVSPLLDGFAAGNAMSEHDGIRCYPAMKENSDEKYIVKVISIPASQVQLDALLLTGAYRDPADAMDYFKEVAESIVQEAELLQRLSKLEGFLPYAGWQIVPMEDGRLGNEVYMLSVYKRSLAKYLRRHAITHLEAINLSLDVCAALAICRRAGYLYADLKPSNIFISKEKEYRIGDLGFVALNSLKFTSLPAKYRSPYSPPEACDDLKTLNETVDTYALGMILYQIYNDGNLPKPLKDPAQAYPMPPNADYEIAEIIMKAIAPNPEKRWKDPMEMGQALVGYMQRNTVNNTPISVATPIEVDPDAVVKLPVKEEPKQPAEEVAESTVLAEAQPDPELTDEVIPDEVVEEESNTVIAEEENVRSISSASSLEEIPVPIPVAVGASSAVSVLEEEPQKKEYDLYAELSQFFDDEEEFGSVAEEEAQIEEEQEADTVGKKSRKPIGKGWILPVVLLLIFALIGCGGFYFYQNYYLQTIDSFTIDGSQNVLTVTVDTDMDASLLTVSCTDTYGNGSTQKLVNGQAVFDNLLPDSLYRIELEVEGFRKLVGKTSDIFTTKALANVVSISAVTGPEDGSVMLNITTDGPDPDEWMVTCTAEGEEIITQTFNGHAVTVRGLTVGKTYTMHLSATNGSEILGNHTIDFTASRLVLAEDLTIISCTGGNMTVQWQPPKDADVENWTVRCYNDGGYDEVLDNITETQVQFSNIDTTKSYTVEVTAAGMTEPNRTSITANPITITSLDVNEDDPSKLSIRWEFEGAKPKDGWLLMYSLDESDSPSVVKCTEETAEISPRIPGATYKFTLQAADGTSIFSNIHSHKCSNAEVFKGHSLSAEKITAHLLKTPTIEDWRYEKISKADFTDTFTSGDKISVVLHANASFYLPQDEISALYVIRDGEGRVIPDLISQETINWNELWFAGDYHYGELDLPKSPDKAGDYSLSIYFNNAAITVITFTVTE